MLARNKLFRPRRRGRILMKKQRSCVRMDDLDKDQRKELNDRIQKTVNDFNKEIQEIPEDSENES